MVEQTVWLAAEEWGRVQQLVPIVCVDVLPLRRAAGSSDEAVEIGLIRRQTPHQGARWCLVGGRLLRNESLPEAICRQVMETLGPGAVVQPPVDLRPVYVAQYFSRPRVGELFDPRQHAVGLTYALMVSGDVRPQGEALDFAWFSPASLPPVEAFGFEQERVVAACLDWLRRDIPRIAKM